MDLLTSTGLGTCLIILTLVVGAPLAHKWNQWQDKQDGADQ